MYFQSLIAHFFLVLNSIPLSGWTIIYLSIHLPVDNLGCGEEAENNVLFLLVFMLSDEKPIN